MNVKLTIEYDGTNYYGWQIQPGHRTVQEALEQALERIVGVKTRVNGSGRTDAGVHALGQVANFVYDGALDLQRLQNGLNALMRPDIVIQKTEAVADIFDARRSARGRVYEYRIWNHSRPSAFQHRFSWHVCSPLNLSVLEETVPVLEGEHDLSSFRAAGCNAAHPVRRIYHNSIRREGDLFIYTIEATAFLRHMVRNIVGTLVELGRGKLSPQAFADILRLRDRRQAGPTAPPHGLFLVEVKYEDS